MKIQAKIVLFWFLVLVNFCVCLGVCFVCVLRYLVDSWNHEHFRSLAKLT